MAPVAPLPFSLADRDIQAIVDAYKEDTANPKYAFKHLFFSVTDPQFRAKPAGVSDLQDGVILSDAERLKTTQTTETFPSRYTSQNTKDETKGAKSSAMPVQVMRIVEALEGKGCRLPLVKGEAQLADKLAIITKQLKGSGAELSKRVQSLLAISRSQANGGVAGSLYLPGSTKIDGQSLADLQEETTCTISGLGDT
ncbi:hypothetical protein MLD38_009420 [Melastoma candidum]|uniref:Uncharacterized protein n=1 Tax=Melastoma candidum TaxID=119954 RepID=A0ACB9RXP5_9MYRT|nr:hypothetical protein MLD38_009420 [Melastoma candidum]